MVNAERMIVGHISSRTSPQRSSQACGGSQSVGASSARCVALLHQSQLEDIRKVKGEANAHAKELIQVVEETTVTQAAATRTKNM